MPLIRYLLYAFYSIQLFPALFAIVVKMVYIVYRKIENTFKTADSFY
jgi:hypothetical protein